MDFVRHKKEVSLETTTQPLPFSRNFHSVGDRTSNTLYSEPPILTSTLSSSKGNRMGQGGG